MDEQVTQTEGLRMALELLNGSVEEIKTDVREIRTDVTTLKVDVAEIKATQATKDKVGENRFTHLIAWAGLLVAVATAIGALGPWLAQLSH